MATSKEAVLTQIDAALAGVNQLARGGRAEDLQGVGEATSSELITRLSAAIDRLAPPGSQYRDNAKATLQMYGVVNAYNIPILAGTLRALRADYAAGHLQRVEEIVQADFFADFLEMAEHLLEQGYKDPAAVLIGGVLEEQLRKLCIRHSVAIDVAGKPKKADSLNSELAGGGVYNKLDQKSVTAWLDLRNKAAPGKYSEYTIDQVNVLLQGVRDFATRHLS